MKNKFIGTIIIISLCFFLACSPEASNSDSTEIHESKTNSNTEVPETIIEETVNETEEELLEYEYDPTRTFFTKVLDIGELMPDDANAATYEAMEIVTSNKYRKILQEKYNQGYYFSLEGRFDESDDPENPPLTGNIIMHSMDFSETQILEVGIENFDFVTAREKFTQENERQSTQLHEELRLELAEQEQSTSINSYEDALQILKKELGVTDDANDLYIFTDLGFIEDSRSYYYINIRQQGEEKSMFIGRVRVYTNNAEILWE